MPFAKYKNERSVDYFVGHVLRADGMIIANPTEEHLKNAGYLPVTEEGEPETEEGKICLPHYEKRATDILLTYEQTDAEDAL